jgi:hypothetical protein
MQKAKSAVRPRWRAWAAGALVLPLVGVVGVASAGHAAVPERQDAEPIYRVVSPVGTSTTEVGSMSPRLGSLDGKTIATIWNHSFKADVTLPVVEQGIKSRYPGAKIVSFREIDAAVREASRSSTATDAEILQAVLRQKGVDAVVSGNGG